MSRIVIVGGGISGLSIAHYLTKQAKAKGADIDLVLLESTKRVGGKIESVWDNGYLCEGGPNGFLSGRVDMMNIASELGLQDKLLSADDSSANRYIFTKGALHQLPGSPPAFLKSKIMSIWGKLRVLKEPLTKQLPDGVDETVAAFGERHLGREAVDQLIGPFVTGVFAGDPEQMSLKSTLPVMAELEKEGSGSLIRAMLRRSKAKKVAAKEMNKPKEDEGPKSEGMFGASGVLTSFNDGMATLTRALQDSLGDVIRTGVKVKSIDRSSKREYPWRIYTDTGEELSSDAVIIAAPANATADMLSDLDDTLADKVGGIPYSAVNVLCLGYPEESTGKLDGFGFLLPLKEQRRILGAVWTSSVFPKQAPSAKSSIRVMIGGARGAEYASLDDEATNRLAQDELHGLMGIKGDPEFSRLWRHERAIPQYVVGHGERLDSIDNRLAMHPGLYLGGNAYRGVSMPDCVRNGKELAERVATQIF